MHNKRFKCSEVCGQHWGWGSCWTSHNLCCLCIPHRTRLPLEGSRHSSTHHSDQCYWQVLTWLATHTVSALHAGGFNIIQICNANTYVNQRKVTSLSPSIQKKKIKFKIKHKAEMHLKIKIKTRLTSTDQPSGIYT